MPDAPDKPVIPDQRLNSMAPALQTGRNWAPMAIGAVLVLVAVALIVILVRNKPVSTQVDPYAAKLQISNLHMETAENFAGGSVTYIEGTLANTGDKKVTDAHMRVIFKNSLGQFVQDEASLPVMVLQPNTPIVDYGPMEHAPLNPGQKRDFRITLEHVSTDWDGQIPEVKVVSAGTS